MGLPALRIEHEATHRGPHLRLVRTTQSSSTRRSKASAAAYEAFVTFCILVAVLALAATGRVWLSAEAASATIRSARLGEEIKAARFEGDMLEVQKTRLASSGRIRRVATMKLGMSVAEKTSYIDLRAAKSPKQASGVVPSTKTSGSVGLSGVLDSVVAVAAGEARVLLVGDVGLSSSR